MARMISLATLLLVYLALVVAATAQTSSAQGSTSDAAKTVPPSPRIQNFNEVKQPNPPDIVCFGYGPKWSVQFANGRARYTGANQAEQSFTGDFYWLADQKEWQWHRASESTSANGSSGLFAAIQKEACHDAVRKDTFPYTGRINLPQGDMVTGCCRKLRLDESMVGAAGSQPTVPSKAPAPTKSSPPPM